MTINYNDVILKLSNGKENAQMKILGLISIIAGSVCAVYGNSLNNNVQAKLDSFLNNGSTNPGDIYLYIGIPLAIIGLGLFIAGLIKNNNNNEKMDAINPNQNETNADNDICYF